MNVDSIRDLAVTLRGQRIERGLTQAQLAERCGVSRKTINLIEAGRSMPSFDLLFRLIDSLDLTLSVTPRQAPQQVSDANLVDLDDVLKRQREP